MNHGKAREEVREGGDSGLGFFRLSQIIAESNCLLRLCSVHF